MKTSLGIWAFGSMVTRFVPGGYQPQWAGGPTEGKVRRAVEGLGDLIDGYEFHYPNELSSENLDTVRNQSTATTSTASQAGCTSTRCSARAGRSPDDRVQQPDQRHPGTAGRRAGGRRRGRLAGLAARRRCTTPSSP